MPVGCLGNTSSSSDQKDLKNHSSVGSHLDEGGGGGNGNNSTVKSNDKNVLITFNTSFSVWFEYFIF